MKRYFKRVLSICLAVTLVFTGVPMTETGLGLLGFVADAAETYYTEDIYTYTVSNDTARITSCDKNVTGNIQIPSVIGGYPVTRIGPSCFYNCSKLVGVIVPEGVTLVSENAFANCTWLESIFLPESLTEIGYQAFANCDSLKSVDIPEGITVLNATFANCDKLESVNLPASVKQLYNSPFSGCSSLVSINVAEQNEVFSSKDGVLYNKSLTKLITYPDSKSSIIEIISSVTEIEINTILNKRKTVQFVVEEGNTAYSSDKYGVLFNADKTRLIRMPVKCSVYNYKIPDTVKSINDEAFYFCENIDVIEMPDSVETIGKSCFAESTVRSIKLSSSLSAINEDAFFCCEYLTDIEIPASVTKVGDYAFGNCYYLENIVFNEGLYIIGNFAFQACESLTELELPATLIEIGQQAFMACFSLEKAVIKSGSLKLAAFTTCKALKSVELGENVRGTINGHTFYENYSLTQFTVNENNPNFCAVDGVLFNKDKSELLVYPCAKSGSEYILPVSVKTIEEMGFAFNKSLKQVILPDGLKTIKDSAFFKSNIEAITVPESVTEMGKNVFNQSPKLVSANVLAKVAEIPEYTFYCCSSLKEVYLTSTVTAIAKHAFNHIKTLCPDGWVVDKVYFNGTQTQWESVNVHDSNIAISSAEMYYLKELGAYTVNFVSGTDSVILPQTKTESVPLVLTTEIPFKEITVVFDPGYAGSIISSKTFASKFLGWNTAADGSGTAYALGAEYIADEDVTLYAQWSDKPAGELPAVTRNGYVFDGWYADGNPDVITEKTVFEKDTTVYAHWKPEEYKAVFKADGVTVDEIIYTVETEKLNEPAVPEKEGYSGDWEAYTLKQGGTEINAVYTAEVYTVTWITDENTKTVDNVTFGQPVEYIGTPEKGGYIFIGWDKGIPQTMPAENLVFNAVWQGPDINNIKESGTCGENIEWKYNKKYGELIISGSGAMPDYDSITNCPWYNQSTSIKKITVADGISNIGNNAFSYCTNLETVCFNTTVKQIGENAFKGCSMLEKIVIPSNVLFIGKNAFDDCTSLEKIHLDGQLTVAAGAIGNTNAVFCSDSAKVIEHLNAQGVTSTERCDYTSVNKLGITAFYHTNDLSADNVRLFVEDLSGKNFGSNNLPVFHSYNKNCAVRNTYSIKLIDSQGNICQPQNGSVVKLRVKVTIDADSIVVRHWESNGDIEDTLCRKQTDSTGSYIEFYVSSFSEFDICVPLDFGYDTESESLLYRHSVTPDLRNNTNEKIVYCSSNPNVAYVDPETGTVTAMGTGSAIITAAIENTNISSSFEVNVTMAWWQWIIRILLLGFLWY